MQQRTQPIIIICRVEARGVLEHPKHPPGHATDDTFWSLVNTQANFSLSLSLSLSSANRIASISNNFTVGFGSFVDKRRGSFVNLDPNRYVSSPEGKS